MQKRRVCYSGRYTRRQKPCLQGTASTVSPTVVNYLGYWEYYRKMVQDYLSTLYTFMSGNYLVIITVIIMVVLSLLLPDISQKLQATQELKDVQKVIEKISNEVKQAEVACLTVADQICYLHCTTHDGTTETSKDLRDLSVNTGHNMRTTKSEPTRVEGRQGFFRRVFFPNGNTSHKEITLMSYVYTDSFDAENRVPAVNNSE